MDEPFGRLRSVWTVVTGQRMFARLSTRPLPMGLPPVVMIHGLAMSSWYLTPVARRLAPFCRLFVPDLPGFGRSPNPPRIQTIAEMADTLAGWMRALGLERAVILGHSVGCQVAARFASSYPEMTLGVILVAPTMDPDISWPLLLLRGVGDLAYEPGVLMRLMVYGFVHATPWRILRTLSYAFDDRCETIYPLIQAPTLVVRGERDPVSSERWGKRVAGMPQRDRALCLLPGRTHTLNMNAPRALLSAILPFLREIAAEPRRSEHAASRRLATAITISELAVTHEALEATNVR